MEFLKALIEGFSLFVGVVTGAACVVLGWWMALVTVRTQTVPMPKFESKADKRARKGRKKKNEETVAAEDDSYEDVLNTDGEG
jgi:hypothetical protein